VTGEGPPSDGVMRDGVMRGGVMSEGVLQSAAAAIAALDAAIETGPQASHEQIAAAFQAVLELRDRVIDEARRGTATTGCRDRVNSLASLAYGGEFPLSGFHAHRLVQARGALAALLADAADGRATSRPPAPGQPAGGEAPLRGGEAG
jgi:hypothetical protein